MPVDVEDNAQFPSTQSAAAPIPVPGSICGLFASHECIRRAVTDLPDFNGCANLIEDARQVGSGGVGSKMPTIIWVG